jgi:hypothetical protein
VFEPNNVLTRHTITVTVETFLNRLCATACSRAISPAAYTVNDSDLQRGRPGQYLTVDIGVAPSEPMSRPVRAGHARMRKVTEDA